MFIILIFSYIGPPFKFYKLKTPQNLALPLLVHVFSAASGSQALAFFPSFKGCLSTLCFLPLGCKMAPSCSLRPNIHSSGRMKGKDKMSSQIAFFLFQKEIPPPSQLASSADISLIKTVICNCIQQQRRYSYICFTISSIRIGCFSSS